MGLLDDRGCARGRGFGRDRVRRARPTELDVRRAIRKSPSLMRARLFCAALCVAAGCSGGSVHFQVDARGFGGARLSVRVVEPSLAKPFTCDDLAFGEVELM